MSERLAVVALLPPAHGPKCPAWDSWPCNCGAKPVPLVTRESALAAIDAAERRLSVAPIAQLRFKRDTPGRENDMPAVVSCIWLPDGLYSVCLAAPSEGDPK